MANARLKLARHAGKRRAHTGSQSEEQGLSEVPAPRTGENGGRAAGNEPPMSMDDGAEEVKAALRERKAAIEARLEELTMGKTMARGQEPGRDAEGARIQRVHRDFLLQEMEWMAADFAQERKWRIKSARMVAMSLASYHKNLESRRARQLKDEELAKRRLAARIGRDVKKFWTKVDKIISYKVKLQSDELRKAAMDRHLKQLIEQTERYSSALATTFSQDSHAVGQDEGTLGDSHETSNNQNSSDDPSAGDQEANEGITEVSEALGLGEERVGRSDSDFEMNDSDEEMDDETTIAAEERMGDVDNHDEEISMLEREATMSIEELRAMYAQNEASVSDGSVDEDNSEHDVVEFVEDRATQSDSDFEMNALDDEMDDETTIEAEEQVEDLGNRDDEISMLEREATMSIEELRVLYAQDVANESDGFADDDSNDSISQASNSSDEFELSDGAEEVDNETTIAIDEAYSSREEVDEEVRRLHEESEMSIDQLRARYAVTLAEQNDEDTDASSTRDEHSDTAVNTTRDTVPTGELSTRRLCGYKRPYILTSRLSLREYQEAGVNWLISMCEKRINGILADEMGLGKTIQTITMLAHLACTRRLWGPHLIVVPTSCMVNWEMEFKRWCPAFKVLTYFGSAKRRKELRQGWSKQNAFQVCITSYQLVVQDAHCFKRKKWYYLILDEAHNIKNWKSLRWQTLLNFSSQRRLLLTGTPLQNNIMELWALMHFLMPHVFASRKEFTHWFQNPLASMVEGEQDVNNQLVTQLHGIIRPFVLRRLKKDVAKQMPGKFEHVIQCKLSKRQRFLYEDFISRSSTRRAMFGRGNGRGANFMSMMNVLMQLRKVCNHPDLFEPRPIAAPLDMPAIQLNVPSRCGFLVDEIVNERPAIAFWNEHKSLVNLELLGVDKYTAVRRRQLFYYDVNAPLPSDARQDATSTRGKHKDIMIRLARLSEQRALYWRNKREHNQQLAKLRVELAEDPVYGSELIQRCTLPVFISHAMDVHVKRSSGRACDLMQVTDALDDMVKDPGKRVAELLPLVTRAVCYVPKARAIPATVHYSGPGFSVSFQAAKEVFHRNHSDFALSRRSRLNRIMDEVAHPTAHKLLDPFHDSFKRTQLFFPDKRLIQFDCGKLQQLDVLLRELKRGNHRCLIFTQMSSMLNILEIFLNIHGHTYFRLDGSTKVEKRQALMERFNRDDKIFCFILSTRSGGLGINLTGADCVIFYDSDWNPAMDAQAQDRAHRIGQTRDVHIYRLVSEHTVEENILRKAQQKRHLDFLVMAEGQFTTDFFSKSNLRELMTGVSSSDGDRADDQADSRADEDETFSAEYDSEPEEEEVSFDTVENAMAQLEDEDDVVAMKGAKAEFLSEQQEFDEEVAPTVRKPEHLGVTSTSGPSTPSSVISTVSEKEDEDMDDGSDSVTDAAPSVEDDAGDNASVEISSDGDDGDTHMAENAGDDDAESLEGSSESEPEETSPPQRKRLPKGHNRRRNVKGLPPNGVMKGSKQNSRRQLEREQVQSERAKEKARERQMELEEEQKLQAWKDSVSSLQGFADSLNPVDRYALNFREEIDPLYSYVPTAAALDDAQHNYTLDIERLEEEKAAEEANLIAEGELIVGVMDEESTLSPLPEDETQLIGKYTQLYKKERAHVHFERRKRLLTGTAWQVMKCIKTNHPFYYNVDTREAVWDRPMIWIKNDQLKLAADQGYAGLMPSVLATVMRFLAPYPDRHRVQLVCKSWHQAATNPAIFMKLNASDLETHRGGRNLSEILKDVPMGDTVVFGSGVYILDDVVHVRTPIKLLAAPDAHVELQMCSPTAQLRWTARGGVVRGFHFSRSENVTGALIEPVSERPAKEKPKYSACWQHLLNVVNGGRVRVQYCDFDGNNSGNACVAVSGEQSLLVLQNNRIYNGGSSGVLLLNGGLVMNLNTVYANRHTGVSVLGGDAVLRRNKIQKNGRFGIRLVYHAGCVVIEQNIVNDHPCGNIDTEFSGRRFVIRWNDMNKEEPDDLPHFHGQLRLTTSKIVDKIIPPPPPKYPVKAPTPTTMPDATSRPLVTAAQSPLLPVPGSLLHVVVPSAASAHVGTTIASVAATLHPTFAPPRPAPTGLPAAYLAVPPRPLTPSAVAHGGVKYPLPVSANATISDQPKRRKKRPKIEHELVNGHIMVFRDSCEKRGVKIKKPRLVKTPVPTPTQSSATSVDAEKTGKGVLTASASAALAPASDTASSTGANANKTSLTTTATEVAGSNTSATATTPAAESEAASAHG